MATAQCEDVAGEAADAMRELLSKSIDRYYNVLSKTGYRQQLIVDNLLMLCAITELPVLLKRYVGKCDTRLLDDATHRLFDHCVIRHPKHDEIKPNPLGLLEEGGDMYRREPLLYADAPDGGDGWGSEPCDKMDKRKCDHCDNKRRYR